MAIKKMKTESISPLLPSEIPVKRTDRLKTKTKSKVKTKKKIVRNPSEAWSSAIEELATRGKPTNLDLKTAALGDGVTDVEFKELPKEPETKTPWPFPKDANAETALDETILEFELGLSRSMNPRPDDAAVTLRLYDEQSGARIQIPLTSSQLGTLLTGGSIGSVKVEMLNVNKLGRTLERKTVKKYIKDAIQGNINEFRIRKLALPYEVDGWLCTGPGFGGSSWSQNDRGYDQVKRKNWIRLHFKRWV